MDYKQKYLKYKQKYLDLKSQLYGGGFEDVWNSLEAQITNEHMIELNNTVKEYVPEFTPHPLTSTIDGISAAFAIMNSPKFEKIKGVKNRNIQPKWYKENPEIIIIHSNPKYFKAFNELIAEINRQKIQKGGANENKDQNKDTFQINLSGRSWNLIQGFGATIFLPFFLTFGLYAVIDSPDQKIAPAPLPYSYSFEEYTEDTRNILNLIKNSFIAFF